MDYPPIFCNHQNPSGLRHIPQKQQEQEIFRSLLPIKYQSDIINTLHANSNCLIGLNDPSYSGKSLILNLNYLS